VDASEVKRAIDRATDTWLEDSELDEDELNQYDILERLGDPQEEIPVRLPQDGDDEYPEKYGWPNGDWNLADIKIMRAIDLASTYPDFEDFFLEAIVELSHLASEEMIQTLEDIDL